MKNPELTAAQTRHFNDLRSWVSSRFGKYNKFYQYQDAFNSHFHDYQPDIQLKLDLDSLNSGLISCAVAALVTGIWWEAQNEYQAEFFMKKVPGKSDNLHKRHVYLALPAIKILSNSQLLGVIKDVTNTKSPQVLDFSLKDKYSGERNFMLNQTPIIDIPENIRRTSGVKQFAKERYNLFNYHPEYLSPPAESSSFPSTHSHPAEQPQK